MSAAKEPKRVLRKYRWQGVLLGVTVLVGGACGSSTHSTSPPTSTSASTSTGGGTNQATGSIVKVGTINSVGNAILDYPDMVAGLRAAARDLNAHGGLMGHQISIDFCNNNGTASGETACAQQMISDHVIATVGDLATMSPDTNSILEHGGIPRVGIVPQSPSDFNSSNVFLFDGGYDFDYAAVPELAKSEGFNAISMVTSSATTIEQLSKAVASNIGVKVNGVVDMPFEVADYTPYAAQLQRQNATFIELAATETTGIGLIKGLSSLGSTPRYAVNNTIFEQSDYAKMGSAANNIYIVGRIPPLSASSEFPGLAHFIQDMNAEAAGGDSAAEMSKVRPIAVEPWLGLLAINEALQQAHQTNVTASTVMSAMGSAKNLSLQGIIPNWTPSNVGPPGYTRVAQAWEYFIKVTNGQANLIQNTPFNVAPVLGAPKS